MIVIIRLNVEQEFRLISETVKQLDWIEILNGKPFRINLNCKKYQAKMIKIKKNAFIEKKK